MKSQPITRFRFMRGFGRVGQCLRSVLVRADLGTAEGTAGDVFGRVLNGISAVGLGLTVLGNLARSSFSCRSVL
jgi:hypothetical protein